MPLAKSGLASGSSRAIAAFCASVVLSSCDPPDTLTANSGSKDSAKGSLRDVISTANRSSQKVISIKLPAGTYVLDQCGTDNDNVAGDLDIVSDAMVTIEGTGSGVVIKQTCPGERVLEAHGSGMLTLVNLTLTGGSLREPDPNTAAVGGGVRARGDVELERVSLVGNFVQGVPGDVPTAAVAADGQTVRGGGVYTDGRLVVTDSIVAFNQATAGAGAEAASGATGGGIAEGGGAYAVGSVWLRGTTLANNRAEGGSCKALLPAGDASGGGVATAGDLAAAEVTAVHNVALGGSNQQAKAGVARGGALSSIGIMSVAESTLSFNQATSGDAVFTCYPRGTASPFGPYSWCGGERPAPAFGGAVWARGELSLGGGTFTQNTVKAGFGGAQASGGICDSYPFVCYGMMVVPPTASGGAAATDASLSVDGGSFISNAAAPGAQIAAVLFAAADASISNARLDASSVQSPSTTAVGLVRIDHSEIRQSGGIQAKSVAGDSITMTKSAGHTIAATTSISLVNSSLVDNSNGLLADSIALVHTTISDPSANYALATKSLATQASFIAANAVAICAPGVVVASSYNWFGDTSCGLSGVGDRQKSGTFLLGPLANNGGTVSTLAPLPASVLVDAIPSGACAVQVDARGVRRPGGKGCDIGSVEVEPLPNTGSADLAVSFVSPPASIAPGAPTRLELKIENHGPAATAPALTLDLPEGITLTSFTGSAGVSCTTAAQSVCTWSAPIASHAVWNLTLVVSLSGASANTAHFHAALVGSQLIAPFTDDAADLTLPVVTQSGISLRIKPEYPLDVCPEGKRCAGAMAEVHNQGPFDAVGTPDAPIRVTFIPAPGVPAPSLNASSDGFIGTIAPGESRVIQSFTLPDQSPPQDFLGTFELHPGENDVVGSTRTVAFRSNLVLTGQRSTAAQASGDATAFSFQVTNRGAGTEENVSVYISPSHEPSAVPFTLEPEAGSVASREGFYYKWTLPPLAPGQTVRLRGSALASYTQSDLALSGYVPTAQASLESQAPFQFDFGSPRTVTLDVSLAPNGTADLRITDLKASASSTPGQYVLRGTVENVGRVPVTGASVYAFGDGYPLYYFAIEATALSPGWDCPDWSPGACGLTTTLPPDATATFDFIVAISGGPTAGTPGPEDRLGVQLNDLTTVPADADPANNRASVPFP